MGVLERTYMRRTTNSEEADIVEKEKKTRKKERDKNEMWFPPSEKVTIREAPVLTAPKEKTALRLCAVRVYV